MDPKQATVCIVDGGLFMPWAKTLSPFFKKVLYFTTWATSFPTSSRVMIGEGFDEFTRIKDIWDVYNDVDLWIFPDVYHGALQAHLRQEGKRVWGAGRAEELELDRVKCKELLKKIGLPVQPYRVIRGLQKLRNYLKENDDKYIKISRYRGDGESRHHIRYDLSEPFLDEWEHTLPVKQYYPFIVEDAIPARAEVGFDGWTIDGRFPVIAGMGIEVKDSGYVGVIKRYADLPKQMREVNEKLSSFFKQNQYRGWFSNELRIGKDGAWYMIDPTIRSPSPPGEVMQLAFSNWGDIVWAGADGELVIPKPSGKYMAQAIIRSNWAQREIQAIYYPPSIENNVTVENACRVDGTVYIIPQETKQAEVGSVRAVDDTMEGAIAKVKRYAAKVEGYQIEILTDSLDDAVDAIKKSGLDFGDK